MSLITSAANAYGTMEQGTLDLAPRSRFNYVVEIQRNGERSPDRYERIRNVSLPNISYDTQIANQYNVKRVIQSRINYGPSTIVFYDTYDNDVLKKLVYPYNANYYHNGAGIQQNLIGLTEVYTNSVIPDNFDNKLGYTLTDNDNRYYIDSVRIHILGPAAAERVYVLKNCLITDISGDTLDYSDSQPVEISITFQPEKVDILEPGL